MGGTSLILTSKPVTSRHLSGLLGLIGPIANASWTHSYAKQCIPSHPPNPLSSHLLTHCAGLKLVPTYKNYPEVQQTVSLIVRHLDS